MFCIGIDDGGDMDSHVTRDGEERCRMSIDELGQLGCAGSCEGDDTGAVLLEESFDDGEPDTSGPQSALCPREYNKINKTLMRL